jgi:hypothetical protein
MKNWRILLVEIPSLSPIAVQTPKAFHSMKFLNLLIVFAKLDFSGKTYNTLLST